MVKELLDADTKLSKIMKVLFVFRYSLDLRVKDYDMEDYEQLCQEMKKANELQFKAYGGTPEAIKEYSEFVDKLDIKLAKWLRFEKIETESAPEKI